MSSSGFRAASSAILERDGRYLLVKRRNPPAADMYAFPGGKAEPGETPEETAVREFEEETGIAVHSPRLVATYRLDAESGAGKSAGGFLLSVFSVQSDSVAVGLAADDALEIGWFTASEIRTLPVPPSVLDCLGKMSV